MPYVVSIYFWQYIMLKNVLKWAQFNRIVKENNFK